MKKLALIGKDIVHSKSQEVYESILGEAVDYTLLDIPTVEDIPVLAELFDAFEGVSITAPYKSVFSGQVWVRDTSVRQLDSINCLRKKDGMYEGVSTDFLALQDHFQDLKKKYTSFSVALLGDGSMSRMTRFILDRMGMKYNLFSRKLGNMADDMDFTGLFSPHGKIILINSCSRAFVFQGKVPGNALFWDYNYGMGEHEEYLCQCCEYKNGYSLLELQARYALDFWGCEGNSVEKFSDQKKKQSFYLTPFLSVQ